MSVKMLKRPNYVVYGPHGEAVSLYCKVCGEQIASTQMRPTRAGHNAPEAPKFTRHSTYAEIKMKMSNGSYHVTNGCRGCLKKDITHDTMLAMYMADMSHLFVLPPLGIQAIECVKIEHSTDGIE